MLKANNAVVLAGLMSFAVVACSPKPTEDAAPAPVTAPAVAPAANTPTTGTTPAAPAEVTPITGIGKVVAIDIPSANLRLDHQPIPALGWMGMTMTFIAADPAILKDIKVGDTVSFEIKKQDRKRGYHQGHEAVELWAEHEEALMRFSSPVTHASCECLRSAISCLLERRT